ncbi:MAG: hypothetical protein M3N43_06505 [Actinomycetota bacterium]|nr:hypothetical protein [Actinomycetota bacterium]
MSRHCSVTLDFQTDEFPDWSGAEIRDWLVTRFEAMQAYYAADLLVTVSGE